MNRKLLDLGLWAIASIPFVESPFGFLFLEMLMASVFYLAIGGNFSLQTGHTNLVMRERVAPYYALKSYRQV